MTLDTARSPRLFLFRLVVFKKEIRTLLSPLRRHMALHAFHRGLIGLVLVTFMAERAGRLLAGLGWAFAGVDDLPHEPVD